MPAYRVEIVGLPGRIGPVTHTAHVIARNGPTAVAVVEHRLRVTDLDYDSASAVRVTRC